MALTDIEAGRLADNVFNNVGPFKNRIINGDMRIDQRNAGAATANTISTYTLDRWTAYQSVVGKFTVQQNAGSVTPPTGFINYLGVTSASAYTLLSSDQYFIKQSIEGFNVDDLSWGTANAKTVTLSFWVRSSLTGTFGGAIQNSAASRNYPFSYTVSAANTWEQKTLTILGDTTGTWLTNNGTGIGVIFNLGTGTSFSATANAWTATSFVSAPTGATSVVGTNGATFYVTGVQLEVGSVATPFEHRSYGDELARCQRYYYKIDGLNDADDYGTGFNTSTTNCRPTIVFPVTMRDAPSAVETTGTATDYKVAHGGTETTCSAVPSFSGASKNNGRVVFTVSSGLTTGQGSAGRANGSNSTLAFSAEL